MKKKVIYYSDLLNDEFSGTNINAVELGEDFVFINKNPIWRFFAFILYYFFAFPLVALFCFFYLHLRVKNKNVLREFRRKGFFLYGNHTGFYDAFVHSVINFPKKSYVIANRDATSIRGLRQIVMMLGALPIPNNIQGMKKFTQAVEKRWQEKKCITVFPEAHIWPYYNKIRPFPATSFRFPVKLNSPVIALVTTYRRRKGPFKNCRPYATVHLSEPFYPDPHLPLKEAQINLRNRVFDWMENCLETKGSYEYVRYEYRQNKNP